MLSFRATQGRPYTILGSPDLFTWSPVGSALVADREEQHFTMDTLSHEPRYFFVVAPSLYEASPVDLLENGLTDWTITGNTPSEWTYSSSSGILTHTKGNSSGSLRRSENWGNFILRLEFRISAQGSSGVFVRAKPDTDRPWEEGSQISISNNDSRGTPYQTGSILGRLAATPEYDPPENQWHSMEVLMIEDSIRVSMNGLVLVDAQNASTAFPLHSWRENGFIGLDDVDSENSGATVEYRNIHLYPLP